MQHITNPAYRTTLIKKRLEQTKAKVRRDDFIWDLVVRLVAIGTLVHLVVKIQDYL